MHITPPPSSHALLPSHPPYPQLVDGGLYHLDLYRDFYGFGRTGQRLTVVEEVADSSAKVALDNAKEAVE